MTVVSGIVGAVAGKKAGDAQADAARDAAQVAQNIFITQREDQTPFREAGLEGLNALSYELGLKDKPQGYGGFKETPGYQFQVSEGLNALDSSAAARGMSQSGAAMKGAVRFGQSMAANEYGTYLNRLGALSGTGQTATNAISAAGTASAQQQGNALIAAGQGKASGYQAVSQGVNYGLSGPTRIAGNALFGGF